MSNSQPITSYVGVDVSKTKLDVYPCSIQTLLNQPRAIGKFLASLPANSHLVCEATGGYERALVSACHQRQLPVSTINPLRIRRFAQAMGELTKTDAIDARMIAAYAHAKLPAAQPAHHPIGKQLADLSAARDNLVARKTQLASLLEHAQLKLVASIYRAEAKTLQTRIKKLEQQMRKLVQSDSALLERDQIQQRFAGVGSVTSWVLLALFAELGSLTGSQAAALSGLAPRNNDSGTHRGKRFIKGGRKRVRDALYMAALTGVRVKGSKLQSLLSPASICGQTGQSRSHRRRSKALALAQCCLAPTFNTHPLKHSCYSGGLTPV